MSSPSNKSNSVSAPVTPAKFRGLTDREMGAVTTTAEQAIRLFEIPPELAQKLRRPSTVAQEFKA